MCAVSTCILFFSRLLWLFRVICGSTQTLGLFFLFLWKILLEFWQEYSAGMIPLVWIGYKILLSLTALLDITVALGFPLLLWQLHMENFAVRFCLTWISGQLNTSAGELLHLLWMSWLGKWSPCAHRSQSKDFIWFVEQVPDSMCKWIFFLFVCVVKFIRGFLNCGLSYGYNISGEKKSSPHEWGELFGLLNTNVQNKNLMFMTGQLPLECLLCQQILNGVFSFSSTGGGRTLLMRKMTGENDVVYLYFFLYL